MKIVSFKICPFVQRVIGILELKNIEYEVEYISLAAKPDWFVKVSPHGQVPILMTEKGVLFESDPIAEYIDEVFDDIKLNPEDPFKKAKNRAWIALATKNYLVQCRTQRSASLEDLKDNQKALAQVFKKIESALENAPFFNGKEISQVDVAWFVILFRTHIVSQCTGVDFLADFPKSSQWRDHLLDIEKLGRSAPEGFLEEFTNFYLNETTYLGQLMREKNGGCGAKEKCDCTPKALAACCS